MNSWLTAEQYETLNTFAPELLGFLLTVMDSNIAVAKGIYEAQRSDIRHLNDRVVMLQEEVNELRRTSDHLLQEMQTLKLERQVSSG